MEPIVKKTRRRRKKKFKNKAVTVNVIPCSLKQRAEWQHFENDAPPKTKAGVYHSSFFNDIPEYGKKRWVVLAELDIELRKLCEEKEFSEEEVVHACVNYLNLAPLRKKYAKRTPKPLYGSLELYKYDIKKKDDPSETKVQVFLITSERKNKHFWREGFKR